MTDKIDNLEKELKLEIQAIKNNMEIMLKNFEERLDESIKELEEQEQKQEKQKEECCKYPRKDQIYYILNECGEILRETRTGDTYDYEVWNSGYGFFTKEDAEYKREKRKVKLEMEKFARPFVSGIENHYVYYDYDREVMLLTSTMLDKDDRLYFGSDKIIKEMLESVGGKRVKKYYLGVKGE